MNTGENEQGLQKVLDMTRLISIVLLILHFYYYCYQAFDEWQLTAALSRDGTASTFKDTIINGMKIKVSSYDYIEPDSKQIIEHRETSPNGQYELIAYRYTNDIHNLNFIHVSIITKGGQIPEYGNYLIGDIHSDYVLNGAWDKNNNIIFYSNKQYADMIQYYLVHNRSNIPYKIIVDDTKYGSKYLWTDPSSR